MAARYETLTAIQPEAEQVNLDNIVAGRKKDIEARGFIAYDPPLPYGLSKKWEIAEHFGLRQLSRRKLNMEDKVRASSEIKDIEGDPLLAEIKPADLENQVDEPKKYERAKRTLKYLSDFLTGFPIYVPGNDHAARSEQVFTVVDTLTTDPAQSKKLRHAIKNQSGEELQETRKALDALQTPESIVFNETYDKVQQLRKNRLSSVRGGVEILTKYVVTNASTKQRLNEISNNMWYLMEGEKEIDGKKEKVGSSYDELTLEKKLQVDDKFAEYSVEIYNLFGVKIGFETKAQEQSQLQDAAG